MTENCLLAQTSLGHGQSGCLIHEMHAESDNVLIKGDCSTWTVEKNYG